MYNQVSSSSPTDPAERQSLLDRLGPEEIAVLDNKRKEVQTVLDEKRKQLKAIQTGKLSVALCSSSSSSIDLSHMMSLPKTKDLSKAIESVKSEVSPSKDEVS